MHSIEHKWVFLQTCHLDHLLACASVCLSGKCTVAKRLTGHGCHLGGEWVGWVYSMGVQIVEGEGADLGLNVGHLIVTNGGFVV